jgi:hypothetical protein
VPTISRVLKISSIGFMLDAGRAHFARLPQVLAVLNILILSMLAVRGFDSPTSARRRFDACPCMPINFVLSTFL